MATSWHKEILNEWREALGVIRNLSVTLGAFMEYVKHGSDEPQKWEYKTISWANYPPDFDAYGRDGWELISVQRVTGYMYEWCSYWKRPTAEKGGE